jgi:hypothetical protein
MSNLGVDNIKGSDGISGPSITGNVVFSGTSHIVLPKGTTAQRPTGVAAGSLRFNTDTKLVEQYNGVEWVTLNSYGVGRGVFGGGYITASPFYINAIDYITITTLGDAETFGDLTQAGGYFAACSSSTRGVFAGGDPTVSTRVNTIDYITIATTGNATDFGDLSKPSFIQGSCSSSTRGVFGGGLISISPANVAVNTIDYITIATPGNAINFGQLTQARRGPAACSSSTRGVFGGGFIGAPAAPATYFNVIEYITIATTGNATDFGDLTQARYGPGSCSSSTRGVFGGGYYIAGPSSQVNTIDYITIASTGNAQTFGQLTQARTESASCSSPTRGVFGGGYGQYTPIAPKYNIIDFITIASQGTNAQTFGSLTVSRGAAAACSDAHGGLS